jgi:23S rRNA (guanosine2251-2'-O)-methyltransferase
MIAYRNMKTAVLILDNIRSVENAASIFRTSDCLGVKKIILIGTTPAPLDRFRRERKDFIKVSLGAEKSVEWEYSNDIKEVLRDLKDQNFQLIALEQTQNSKDLRIFEAGNQFALVVGNEVDGVSKDVLKFVDETVEIQMSGQKESLNVSVAAGIGLYALIK